MLYKIIIKLIQVEFSHNYFVHILSSFNKNITNKQTGYFVYDHSELFIVPFVAAATATAAMAFVKIYLLR